jgi:hypothetical protein
MRAFLPYRAPSGKGSNGSTAPFEFQWLDLRRPANRVFTATRAGTYEGCRILNFLEWARLATRAG